MYHLNGCPDSDDDGVIDIEDDCPDKPGRMKDNGCPIENIDSDGDGVMDTEDRCPEVKGDTDNNGCPEVKKEDQETLDFAMTNVEFQTGSDELTMSSKDVLNKIADIMKRYKGYRLIINGHTDNIGDPAKNLELSKRRAEACFNYLFIQGINPTVLSYTGYGDAQPVADNKSDAGRRQNRRVEFILTTER